MKMGFLRILFLFIAFLPIELFASKSVISYKLTDSNGVELNNTTALKKIKSNLEKYIVKLSAPISTFSYFYFNDLASKSYKNKSYVKDFLENTISRFAKQSEDYLGQGLYVAYDDDSTKMFTRTNMPSMLVVEFKMGARILYDPIDIDAMSPYDVFVSINDQSKVNDDCNLKLIKWVSNNGYSAPCRELILQALQELKVDVITYYNSGWSIVVKSDNIDFSNSEILVGDELTPLNKQKLKSYLPERRLFLMHPDRHKFDEIYKLDGK